MANTKAGLVISVKEVTSLPHQPDKTLLQSLEAQNIEVHYHCREGYCGACRCRLLKGQVEYSVDPLAYVDDDEILPCCCHPLSDIEIEFS